MVKAAFGVATSTVVPRSSVRRSKEADPVVTLNWRNPTSWFAKPTWVFAHPRTNAREPIWSSRLPGDPV